MMITRRTFMTCLAALAVSTPALAQPRNMSAQQAHDAASKGDILLLDIRSREEWRETGIGESAQPVSMHERDFLDRLQSLTGGDKSKPVALICAVGGRSHAVQGILTRMGWSNVISVPEGMLGSQSGQGWVKSGLPVKRFTE